MNEHDERDIGRIRGLERLAMRRAPERDLWPGIQVRLKPRAPRRAWLPMALAASLVVAVTATLLSQVAPPPAPDEVAPALPLTADARAIVKANLSITRYAEGQLRQALKRDPDSPALRALLTEVEQRQRALHAML